MQTIKPKPEDLKCTLRRYHLDDFQVRQVALWPANALVLDLGGNKMDKRGQFDIAQYPLKVVYANWSTLKSPDVRADAASLPFATGVFDAVICAELLEHVYQPLHVIEEVHRVLKPAGRLLLTVPFLVPIHGDPDDFGRHTGSYWRRLLGENGFDEIGIEKQGSFAAVLLDMLRVWYLNRPSASVFDSVLGRLVKMGLVWGRRRELNNLGAARPRIEGALSGFTTGYGITASKAVATGRAAGE